jgi:hypothetical protein
MGKSWEAKLARNALRGSEIAGRACASVRENCGIVESATAEQWRCNLSSD